MSLNALHNLLLNQPLIVLFALIATGLLLGGVKVKGINLGSSGVLFTALLAGHLGYSIPAGVGTLGLVLFVYCVGIGAGDRFFASLVREGAALANFLKGTTVTKARIANDRCDQVAGLQRSPTGAHNELTNRHGASG